MELRVLDIKLKIIRGRTKPRARRFQYSTLIQYIIEGDAEEIVLDMGIIPPTYFFIKAVMNEDLDDLERVILHTIKDDSRKILRELFIENNLLNLNLKKGLASSLDRVVIDDIISQGKWDYIFVASIYLTNGQRIPHVVPTEAVILALLAGKKEEIYVTDKLLTAKAKLDQELKSRLETTLEPGAGKESEEKKPTIPKNLYT
ncbi:MAG: hypothetical protein ACTSRS_19940 [Candidatus Helarchaeota archaeon]